MRPSFAMLRARHAARGGDGARHHEPGAGGREAPPRCDASSPTAPPGAIVNVSWHQAQRAVPGALPYATAKAAIEGLTRALAVDYAPRGIRVNAVAVGSIVTERYDQALDRQLRRFIHSAVSAAAKKSLLSSITFSPTT